MNQPRIAAIGTFDGLHRGHVSVIEIVKELAEQKGGIPTVVTFDCHPLEVIRPEQAPKRIMPPNEVSEALCKMGVAPVMVAFSKDTSTLTAKEWMEKLGKEYDVTAIVMGYDNVFGCDGMNLDLSDYKRIGDTLGIEIVKAAEIAGVSSSAIRRLLQKGMMEEAAKLLGHPFSITGIVHHGDSLGKQLGYPTANICFYPTQLIPRHGVYIVDVTLPGGERRRGVANVGVRPTVSAQQEAPRLEVHIPGYDGDLYHKKINVDFLKFLRPEIKFSKKEQLTEQIADDCRKAMSEV